MLRYIIAIIHVECIQKTEKKASVVAKQTKKKKIITYFIARLLSCSIHVFERNMYIAYVHCLYIFLSLTFLSHLSLLCTKRFIYM